MNEDIKVILDTPEEVNVELDAGSIQYGRLSIGTTTTGEAGTKANVENVGSPANAVLNFTIPKGDRGEQGIQGIQGEKGDPNKLTIGTVEKGEEAAATITGNSPNQVLNLVLPKGDKGDNPKSVDEQSGSNLLIEASEYNAKEFIVYGNSKQETRSGKNLFDKNNVMSGYFNTSGSIVNSSSWYHQFIKAKSNESYVISGVATTNPTPQVVEYDKDMNFIQRIMSYRVGYFTTNENTAYIGVSVLNTDLDTYQLELGSTITEYEPYGAMPSPDYPSEIKTVKGIENLFNKDSGFEKAYLDTTGKQINNNNVALFGYIEVSPSTQYTISLKERLEFRYGFYDADKTFISRSDAYYGNNTFKTPSNTKYLRMFINVQKTATQEIIDSLDIQIEEGSITHPFVPYGSRYLIDKITGKNIFDGELESGGINSSGNNYTDSSLIRSKNYIPVQSNKTYIISNNGIGVAVNVIEYDKTQKFISTKTISANNSFITNNLTKYIRIYRGSTNTDKLQVELEKITEYEPYKENIITYDLKGNELVSIGDIKDELDEATGVLTKRIGKVVLDGVNNKFLSKHSTIYTDTNGFYGFQLPNKISGKNGDINHAICNHLTYIAESYASQVVNRVGLWWESSVATNYASIPFLTLTEANQWLVDEYNNGTPVTVYYELATPEIIQLDKANISLFEGTNNITLVEDLETELHIKYYTPFKGNKGEGYISGTNENGNYIKFDNGICIYTDSEGKLVLGYMDSTA